MKSSKTSFLRNCISGWNVRILNFLRGDFSFLPEERKISSEVSFHSSEVSFVSSEVFFYSSEEISQYFPGYFRHFA